MKTQTTPSTGNSTGTTAHDITTAEPTPRRHEISESFTDYFNSGGLVLSGEVLSRCIAALSGIRTITEILHKNELDEGCDEGIKLTPYVYGGLLAGASVCIETLEYALEGMVGGSALINRKQDDYKTITDLIVREQDRQHRRMNGGRS